MQAYINYKIWWTKIQRQRYITADEWRVDNVRVDNDFKDHINEMTLHELMEKLIDWS